MGFMKNTLLVALGGLTGLFVAAILDGEEKVKEAGEEKEPSAEASKETEGIELLAAQIREEAEAAMEGCKTQEEREMVYTQVEESVRAMQAKLQEKGEAIIENLKAQAVESKTEEVPVSEYVQNLQDKLQAITKALDETLESLKPEPNPAV